MALMLLLREYLQKNRIKTSLLAVTVDHQLRAESNREALEVAKICAKRGGITHVTKVCHWYSEDEAGGLKDPSRPAKPRESKMEEQARQYRYDLLKQVCEEYRVRCLFVAHNLGDQLERRFSASDGPAASTDSQALRTKCRSALSTSRQAIQVTVSPRRL